MAASRGDLGIGGDRTTKSPITGRSRPSSQNSSVVSEQTGKIANEENKTGRVAGEIQGRNSTADETRKSKSLPPVRDKTSKDSNIGQEPRIAFNAGIKGAKSLPQRDDAYERPTDRKRASVDSDNTGQIKKARRAKTRRKAEMKQGSISARVIYKLVGTANKQRRDFSPRRYRSENHANLIVVDASCGTSRDVEPSKTSRKLADSWKTDAGSWKTGSPRPGESRSSSDPKDRVGQTGGENRGEKSPRPSPCGESCPRKCCGVVECEVRWTHEEKRGRDADRREFGRKQSESPVPPLLCRARSLPRLSVHDSGVACSEQSPAAGHPHNSKQQLAADLRQLHTLKQHYYPEGGWGWVVLLVGMLVQMLSHGVHGSSGILLRHVADKFGQRVYLETGKFLKFDLNSTFFEIIYIFVHRWFTIRSW